MLTYDGLTIPRLSHVSLSLKPIQLQNVLVKKIQFPAHHQRISENEWKPNYHNQKIQYDILGKMSPQIVGIMSRP